MALRRPWPSDGEGPGLEPPLSIEQTSTVSSGPGASTVAAAANLLGRGLAAAVTGGNSLLRGSNASGGGSSGGTPRAGTPAADKDRRPSYQLFAAFDGHNGAEAARFAEHSIVPILEIFLPPWSSLALFPAEPAELAAQLQQALALAFLELHRQFAMAGCLGGCAATVVLQVGRLGRGWGRAGQGRGSGRGRRVEGQRQHGARGHSCTRATVTASSIAPLPTLRGCPSFMLLSKLKAAHFAPQVGRLVTVASVGSCRCLLFTGAPGEAPMALTEEHRIHTHVKERQRLLSVSEEMECRGQCEVV